MTEIGRADSDPAPRSGGDEQVWARTIVILVAVVFLVVAWVVSTGYIGDRADDRVQGELVASRDQVAGALVREVPDVIADTRFWAGDPSVVGATRALLEVPTDALVDHPVQADVRRTGARFIGVKELRGYFLISPDGVSLASSRDANIGVPNLIAEEFPLVFEEVLAGETVVTPLQRTDVPLETEMGLDPDAATLFVATPIVDEGGEVIAVFALRIDPLTELASILEAEQLDLGGAALLIDRAGSVLTADGEVFFDASGGVETAAVRSVKEGLTGSTLESYRGIDGAQMVGGWRWLPDLQVGVISEASPQSAFTGSDTAQRVVTVFAVAVGVLLFAVWLIPLMASRSRSRERNSYLARLHDSEAVSRAVLDTAVDAILTIDELGTIISANPAAEAMFGWQVDEMIGHNVAMLMPEPYRSEHDSYLQHYVDGGPARIIGIGRDVRGRRRDGTEFPLALSISEAELADRRIFAGVARDISDQKAAEAALATQAITDQLTGLSNRQAFNDDLAEIFSNDEADVAILFVDIDDFKSVNDSLGHHIGDEVLIAAVERLSSALRQGDVLYRSAGDEFLVVARDIPDSDAADAVARHICTAVADDDLDAGGHSIRVTVSVGVAERRAVDEGSQSLVIAADLALLAAKSNGRNCHMPFDFSLRAAADERNAIEHDLKQILADDELTAHYQPVVDLGTGMVVGAEALARWHRPGHGMVGPDVFIPIAERSDMINEIGSWMLHRACQDAVSWNEDRIEPIGVAVNISPPQIDSDDFISSVHSALATAGLPAELLTLEITESVLIRDRWKVATTLDEVAALGVEIALDDFGTGYSSLAYLSDFAISKVKIDRSFVNAANSDEDAIAMLEAIVTLVRRIGLDVIAEGVEQVEEVELVTELGCDLAQGYFWARPAPRDEFIEEVFRIEHRTTNGPGPTSGNVTNTLPAP